MRTKTLGVIAGLIAVHALALAVAARRAERRHPPRGRFVTVDGLRLHYLEAGPPDGPPVILLHGNGATADDWAASGLLGRLARRHRVIAFDRPGFGYSDRPWLPQPPEAQARLLAEAAARLGIDRAVVVGHSWGTLVALAMALERPARVAGLVLAAGYYVPTRRLDVWLVSGPALPIVGPLLRYTVAPILARLVAPRVIRRLFAPVAVPAAFTSGFPVPLALRPSQLRATAEESALMIPAARRLAARYGEIGCPVTVFAAAGDRLVESSHGPHLRAALPGAALHVVPGAGHMLHYAVPDEIALAVTAQAATAAPAAAGRDTAERHTADAPPLLPDLPAVTTPAQG
ncbi:Haloalkane dehalogenase [Rhodoplanes serenus]|uniref:Haloalkane dehalogenase n=1 Tax=Rhodoplanes serenus TaxID=200615 RepID=A0A447CSK4_9BRAD|nr:alpha/beta hydrolase [Rhodoplanes serenus]VCU08201.1 Haloalkane dehalogenase [Rhodoplanes serenus]